jgi:hypothetical protein
VIRPALASLVVLVLGGCGGTASDATVPGPDGDVSCDQVIDGHVGNALSWDTSTNVLDVEAVDGECRLEYLALGTVTVGELTGDGSARQRIMDTCATLSPDEDLTAKLVGGGTGCATGLDPATQTGEAQLVMLTQDGVALRLRIEATAPVEPARLRAAFSALAHNAQEAW